MRDELLDPSEFVGFGQLADCGIFEAVIAVDNKAVKDIRETNEKLFKWRAAATGAPLGSIGARNARSLDDALDVGRVIEQRIQEQGALLNVQAMRSCNPGT
eukprot:2456754-Prymnesium_polylepis.2